MYIDNKINQSTEEAANAFDKDFFDLMIDDKGQLTFLGCLAAFMLSNEFLKIFNKIRKGE